MAGRFDISDTALEGLKVLTRKPVGDSRGYLERMFCTHDLADVLNGRGVAQINRTLTRKVGTVRGLHFQRAPAAEMKFVSCLQGEVFDVAVDLRPHSRTFLAWHGERLTAENGRTLLIPEGFAHGFQTLSQDCILLYLHTAPYTPSAEDGLNGLDERIGISWPLPVGEMSVRDAALPRVGSDFVGVHL